MIIQSIHAENFRRYETLTIENIPERGIITVDGDNEAGKSTISDALCFSLFGRTFFINHNNIHKLIKWNADYCVTTISFRISGKLYSLMRTCDREGSIAAQLLDGDKDIIADTVKEVDEKLLDILGYGYDIFADSFYLMQRELTTPDSNSIKTMVGIHQYAEIINECKANSRNDHQQLDELRLQFQDLFEEIENIGLDETWLPELVDARETLNSLNTEKKQYTHLLDQNIQDYAENYPKYQKTLKHYTIANNVSNILLPITIIVWLVWSIIEFFPSLLKDIPFSSEPLFINVLLPSGLFIAVIYAICLFYSWWLDSKYIKPLQKKANETKRTLEGALQQINQANEDIPERVTTMLTSIADVDDLLPVSSLYEADNTELVENITQYNSTPKTMKKALIDIKHDLNHQRNTISHHLEVLHNAIEGETARADEAGRLRQQRNKIGAKIKTHSHNIKVNDQAIQLLKSSAAKLSEQFNEIITKNSSRILPSFTNGHYHQIQIDKNLQVKVFSKEKDDFIDFDEVSSGTQRQIMLSLRIAMSEQLAINKGNQQQFILLDEPFAFFDQKRTLETLEALPEVSDVISQIWVFSQEFPDTFKADKVIHCNVEQIQLIV